MYLKFFIFIFLSLFPLQISASQDLLKTSDVNKIMEQILSQHIEQKEMSGTILKNALRVYIDQFDPSRIYLLDEEVQPFLSISDTDTSRILDQYQKGQFLIFEKLNSTIQKAIMRGRALRIELASEKNRWVHLPKSTGKQEWDDPNLKQTFPKTRMELKDQVRENILKYLGNEQERFGKSAITQHLDKTLSLYEKRAQADENSYLFVTDEGFPVSPVQKEHLLTVRVLKALANSLDAHTTFYNRTEAYDMKVHLEKAFEGIGVVLQQAPDGTIVIKKLIEGGPAEKSGRLQTNDILLSIDGKTVAETPFDKVMQQLRGAKGSAVSLKIERKNTQNKTPDIFEVTLQREALALNEDRVEVSEESFGNGIIGKIVLHSFYQGENGVSSESDVRKAIIGLQKKGKLRGLILDLRENSGGFLSQAVKVAGLFITNGVIVISKYSDGRELYYRDMDGKVAYDGPLIVLTSKATASAAEIVAQALQDYGAAVVVGDEHTYGKGTIQSQTVTDDQASSYFKVTIGKYYTVSGKTPQIRGVKADVVVPGPFSQEHIGEEFLNQTLTTDEIQSAYKDSLTDIDPNLKPWYLRYYMPTLQKPNQYWHYMLPTLQQNSAYRISNNKNYQMFLNKLKGLPTPQEDDMDEGATARPNYGLDDMQMTEAVNIAKDMILMQDHYRHIQTAIQSRQFSGTKLTK
jgi:carboxyl-terminal processing protease